MKDNLFAQYLAGGMDQLEAYHKAGFKGATGNASRKANQPHIIEKVKKLQGKILKSIIIDKKWVLDRLVRNYERADAAEDFGSCNHSLKLIGTELGMFIDRRDVRVYAKFENLSDGDLLKHLETLTERLAIADQSPEAV